MSANLMPLWQERTTAWHARVTTMGVERAVYHKGHRGPDFSAVTEMQYRAIWPHLLAALRPTHRQVLDFGCGHGRWTPLLADAVASVDGCAIGVDPTPEFLALAESRRTSDRVAYRQLELGHIPVDDCWADVLFSCMVLSTILHDDILQLTLEEWGRVTHMGSLIVLVDNTSHGDGRPIRSGDSMSRTVREYQDLFRGWVSLTRVGEYRDFGEINSVLVGEVYA